MTLSLSIILDRISDFKFDAHIKLPSDKEFNRASLLPKDPGLLREDRLYVCKLSDAISITSEYGSKYCFLCLRDRIQDSGETDELLSGLVIVNENINFEDLFERVQDVFYDIISWYDKAQRMAISGSTLQDILDISETVLQNYVQITDSSFKLLAYTKNIYCDEPIVLDCQKYGCHSEETIRIFKKYRRMEAWEDANGMLINDEKSFTKYQLVSKIYRYRSTYFAHSVMTCNVRPATQGVIEIFGMFVDIVEICVRRSWENLNSVSHVYDSFITDLIEGSFRRRDNVEERAKVVGIPYEGVFTMGVTSSDEGGRLTAASLAKELSSFFPDDKLLIYGGHVVILSTYSEKNYLEQFAAKRETIRPVLDKYLIKCGFSAFFTNLLECPKAYQQAELSLKFSGNTPGAEMLPNVEGAINGLMTPDTSFEESFFYILLGESKINLDIWQGSVYYEGLKRLKEYDELHNLNNLQLLYVYLTNERRLTETAAQMHMSRNNVVYRIGRIEDMLNMSLESAATRFKLQLSYIMLQLYSIE